MDMYLFYDTSRRAEILMNTLSDLWLNIPTDILRLIINMVIHMESYEECVWLENLLKGTHMCFIETGILSSRNLLRRFDQLDNDHYMKHRLVNVVPSRPPIIINEIALRNEIRCNLDRLHKRKQNYHRYFERHPCLADYLFGRIYRKNCLHVRMKGDHVIMDRIIQIKESLVLYGLDGHKKNLN